jgi:hypothetical protein
MGKVHGVMDNSQNAKARWEHEWQKNEWEYFFKFIIAKKNAKSLSPNQTKEMRD